MRQTASCYVARVTSSRNTKMPYYEGKHSACICAELRYGMKHFNKMRNEKRHKKEQLATLMLMADSLTKSESISI